MIHLMHKRGRPAGHRPARAVAWLAGAVLLFGGAAWADRLDKDPVEQFRQALILEPGRGVELKGSSLAKALAFRKQNLNDTAAKVVSLSDLSRALLLLEWLFFNDPTLGEGESFEAASHRIVVAVRADMASRFNEGIEAALEKDSKASNARKIAVANLVGETIAKASDQSDYSRAAEKKESKPDAEKEESKKAAEKKDSKKARLVSDIEIELFAKLLAEMTKIPNDRVNVAVAGALGQFREHPKDAGPSLKRLLSNTHGEAAHLAAASSLVNLSSSVSYKVSLKGSEPGVSRSEPRNFSALTVDQTLNLLEEVAAAAAAGLRDSSVDVRRQCVVAMRNVVTEVADPNFIGEVAIIKRADLEKAIKRLDAVLLRYTKDYTGVLGEALRDRDEAVRVDARKTLRELGHFRQALRNLRASIPVVGRQDRAGKADGNTNPLDEGETERLLGGARDPSARVRRAAHEAIEARVEALGDDAAKFLPELAKSLEDKDLFVRWIAARTMRRLAAQYDRRRETLLIDARIQGKERSILKEITKEYDRRRGIHLANDVVVPALIKGLDDEDLDGRIAVTRALGAYGPDAKDAVPALAKLVGKGEAEYRVFVLKALAGIGDDSRSALPEVVAAFKADDPRVRGEAARLVGLLSKYAASYVDDLEKLAGDPDPKVRELAGAAILRIQPE